MVQADRPSDAGDQGVPVLHVIGDVETVQTDPQAGQVGLGEGAERINNLLLDRVDRSPLGQQATAVQDVGLLAEPGLDLTRWSACGRGRGEGAELAGNDHADDQGGAELGVMESERGSRAVQLSLDDLVDRAVDRTPSEGGQHPGPQASVQWQHLVPGRHDRWWVHGVVGRQRHSRNVEGGGEGSQGPPVALECLTQMGNGFLVQVWLSRFLNQDADSGSHGGHGHIRINRGSGGPCGREPAGEVIAYGIEMGGDLSRVQVAGGVDVVEGLGCNHARGRLVGDRAVAVGKLPGAGKVQLLRIARSDAASPADLFEHPVPPVRGPQQLCMVGDEGGELGGGVRAKKGSGELGVQFGPHDQRVDQTLHGAGQRGPVPSGQHRIRQPGATPSLVEDDTTRQGHAVAGHRQSPEGGYDRAMPELTPEAIEVRDLVVDVAGALDRRRAAWQPALDRARALAATITDPLSGPDARMRVANIDHLLALRAGDPAAAMTHLDSCLGIIDQLRAWHHEHDSDQAELIRLNDHEWGVRLNRCQVWQALGDWDEAWVDVERSLALAEVSLEPAKHKAMSLLSASAIKLETDQFADAIRLAEQQVELSRRDSPDTLGQALLSLAQAQARVGAYADASTSAERAAPLIADDVTAMASLHQLRGFLAMAGRDMAAAERHFADHADHTAHHAEALTPDHRSEAAKSRAFLLHSKGKLTEARREYQAEVERSRESGDPIRLAAALCQLSGVTQDIALSRITFRSSSMHEQALVEVNEAQQHAAAADRRHLAAGLDVQYAKYIAQFHETVTRRNADAMVAGLERCLAATVFLHRSTFRVPTARGRRAMAERHTSEAFDICFALAFRLGVKELVAELIELRCAAGQFQSEAAGPTEPGAATVVELDDLDGPNASTLGGAAAGASRVLLAPPPPLLFSPERVVLTEAFDNASRRYGVRGHDDRPAVATW